MKTALILGSSKGIGKAIFQELKKMNIRIYNPKRSELDTRNIKQIENYVLKLKSVNYLILNTGGPPKKNFFKIDKSDWINYFNQLFLGFVIILQKLKIKKNGYIFLISSHTIKNPENELVLSNSFRVAISSVFKTISHLYAVKNVSCVNIAPGPIKTQRLINLVKDLKKFEKTLPMKKAGDPKEIGKFIKSIITDNIKNLNGVTINFDGGISKNLF
jgi:3-oxoacyl-[acyl-carrier protein] reductase